jgi:hypothetical protein
MGNEARWRRLYLIAAIALMLMIAFVLVDMGISMALPEGDIDPATLNAADWFGRFNSHPLYALRDYGIFNICNIILGIPVFLALVHSHRRINAPFALLAAALAVFGGGVYIANNTALPMLGLSHTYAAAPEAQRAAIEAAGTALLARGADFTYGSLIGLLFPTLGGMLMAGVVLMGNVFRKYVGYVGLAAYLLLSVYTVMAVCWPGSFDTTMIIAAPGGLLLLVWNVALMCRFLKWSNTRRSEA